MAFNTTKRDRFKKYFFSGLAVFLPLALTVYVFIWLMNFAESLFGRYLKPFFLENYDFYFWGLGIVALFAIILFCGFLATNYFGRSLHRLAEKLVLKIPLMGSIYPAFKEIAKFFFHERTKFEQAVLIEWPRQGCYTIGFLTNKTAKKISNKMGKNLCNVMIPKVPNPLTGYLVMLPEDEVFPLDITVEEAIKMIVSGGVLNAENVNENGPSA